MLAVLIAARVNVFIPYRHAVAAAAKNWLVIVYVHSKVQVPNSITQTRPDVRGQRSGLHTQCNIEPPSTSYVLHSTAQVKMTGMTWMGTTSSLRDLGGPPPSGPPPPPPPCTGCLTPVRPTGPQPDRTH